MIPDKQKLFRILRAYGNFDTKVSYAQGYPFIVTMLLHYISNEEDVFFCLLKIMGNLNWRQHFLKPYRQPDIVNELHELISLYIPDLCTQLEQDGMKDSLLNNLYNYTIPSMCTGGYIPIEISARVFELVIFEDYGDVTLVRLIIYMLMI